MRSQGTPVDLLIKSPDEWYFPGSPRVIEGRRGAFIRASEIQIAPSDATNIYNCVPEPVPIPDALCTGFTVTDAATFACNAPKLGSLAYCEKHARERGLIVDAAPTPPVTVVQVQPSIVQPTAPSNGKRTRAPHKSGCKCIACSKARARQERIAQSGRSAAQMMVTVPRPVPR